MKTESQGGSGGPPEKHMRFASGRDRKEKRKKSLNATRFAEIRFQIYNKQKIERVLMYRLLRTQKLGIKKIIYVLMFLHIKLYLFY
jgi:hypothetical protein